MAEIRETLRFNSTDLEELNRVMGRLQDRLDALEGLRGQPAFHADVDFKDKALLNVSQITQETTETTPSPGTDQTTMNIPMVLLSTLDVHGSSTLRSTLQVLGTSTFNGAVVFNRAVSFADKSIIVPYFTSVPTSSDIPDKGIGLYYSGSQYYLYANFGGSLVSVELT